MAQMSERTQIRLKRLADSARASAEQAADDRAARDAAIMEADRDGVAVRAIARAAGISMGHISKILAAQTALEQQAEGPDLEA